MNITRQQFRNLICLMHNIDSWDLPDRWSGEQQSAFLRNPIDSFLRADDKRADEVWAIMMKRASR